MFHVIANMHTPESDGTAQSVQSQGGPTTQATNCSLLSDIFKFKFDVVSGGMPEYIFTNSALFLKKLECSKMIQSPYVGLL